MEIMAKKMLIDATHAEETRVVVVEGNKVEEFDFESENRRQLAGNIYLAKVTRIEPSLQAAFIDYGGNRHGFLAFSEVHPDYYQIPVADREALMEEERAFSEALRRKDDEEDSDELLENESQNKEEVVEESEIAQSSMTKDAKVDLVVSAWAIENLYYFAFSGITSLQIDESFDDSVDYIKSLQTSGGGFKRFLSDHESQDNLTGAGVYCLQLWKNAKSPESKSGLEKIVHERLRLNLRNLHSFEMFFNTLSAYISTHFTSKYWREWNKGYQFVLIDSQSNNGSWPPGSTHDHETQLYRTNLFLHSLILPPLSLHATVRYLK